MTQEEEKYRYQQIVYRLRIIMNEMNNLNNTITTLQDLTNQNLAIDDKGYKREMLDDMKNRVSNSSSYIQNYIIPSLNYKIYN